MTARKLVGFATACSVGAVTMVSQQAAAQAVGPDVIVGELIDVGNYTTAGPVNGYRAYAVGTTSCNLGTQTLQWIRSTNKHPVIGQSMYRLLNGRFEQIGQSWLKHGFTALQQTACSTSCAPNPNGTALGILCSDPYTWTLNGSQSGLGPKSEVVASTGFYPYPWVNNGTADSYDNTNRDLFKRLQVLDSDVGIPGALYFVTGIYVTHDDALANNKDNNVSYRRVTVGATAAKNLTLVDTTQRQKPGIFAWRDHGLGANQPDPGVLITSADLDGDAAFTEGVVGQVAKGRYYIAAKATDIGGGQWRYEYALYNQNSDRSGASFAVPLPPNAVVDTGATDNTKAPRFAGVKYHSGEPFTNASSWNSAVSASQISWSLGQTFAQNANANALRWDTMFNFGFVCNLPPTTGQATMAAFKPGTAGAPATLTLNTLIPSADGQPHPINDAYQFAAPVGVGTTPFSTANTVSEGPAVTNCGFSPSTAFNNDVWYTFTAACNGTHQITLCGSAFDTKLAVYPGSVAPTEANAIACNDDDPLCATSTDFKQSTVSFAATSGQTYLVRIGTATNQVGNGSMTISTPGCTGGSQAPANDVRANAIFVADGVQVSGSTSLATTDPIASPSCGTVGKDVWFKYRPQTSGVINFQTCGSNFDTIITVYYPNGSGGELSACNDNAQSGTCQGTSQSRAAVVGVAGTEYTIRVAGRNGSSGNYNLLVSGGGGVLPPANDNCASRVAIGVGNTNFSTLMSTTDGPISTNCSGGTGEFTNDVWYHFTAPSTGRLQASTCGSTYDSRLAVYSGAGCANLDSRLAKCNDDSGVCGGGASNLILPVTAGGFYTIRVGGKNGAQGTGTLALTMLPPCVADVSPDGGVTIEDLLVYLEAFGSGTTAADIDDGSGTNSPDGGVSIEDLLFYLARFEAGC